MQPYPLNAKCPCGSDRKFKRCHGHLMSRGDRRRVTAEVYRHLLAQRMPRRDPPRSVAGICMLQWVIWWSPRDWRIDVRWLPYPSKENPVYKWRIQLGPVEVRRWARRY